MGSALVLGGGGITGIAWEIGVLHGLAEAGVKLADADTVIGTSAGSVVGAQLTAEPDTAALYERQLADPTGELAASMNKLVMLRYAWAMLRARGERDTLARVGRLALRTRTVPESDRRAVIASRLVSHEWPDADLRVTAVRADTGEFRVFDRASGVSLVDAVAASCAVPGVWPPMTLDGARYVDGGVRSVANVDLATGCAPVIALAPMPQSLGGASGPGAQARSLEQAGARVLLVTPDKAATAAFGKNPLDPAKRAASARAGYAQARDVVSGARAMWQ